MAREQLCAAHVCGGGRKPAAIETRSRYPENSKGGRLRCGAQRVSDASGSRADDARTSPLRCQAPSRREPDAQGLDAGRLEKTPVQAGDAKMVEACCKLAVQAAHRTAEGGRCHRDGQRSDLASSDSLRSEVAIRRCCWWARADRSAAAPHQGRVFGRRDDTVFCCTCHGDHKLVGSCLLET